MFAARQAWRWLGSGLVAMAVCAALPATAPAASFTNSDGITLNDSLGDCEPGTAQGASPYPSQIDVSGLPGVVTDVNVTLTGLTHEFVSDLRVLLVGPEGQSTFLMEGAGGGAVSDLTLTLDDEAPEQIPAQLTGSGTYQPSTPSGCANQAFPAPGPSGPFGEWLDAFDGSAPNGLWRLYVVDDISGDSGSIGAWSLEITSEVPDTTAPVTTITSAPAAVSNDTTPRFEFTADEPATFLCAVDTATVIEPFVDCSSPYDRTLPDGEYTFYVYAVDTAGYGGDYVTHDFVIDTGRPSASVQPSAGQNDPTNTSPISFDVEFSEPVTGFTGSDVTLGGTAGATTAGVSVSGSGTSYVVTVSDMASGGTVTVSVPAGAATDEATNPNTASGTATITYDSTPPQTTISGGPAGPTNDATPTFTFASSETGSTLQCAIDEGAFYDCDSPTSDTVAELGEGPHTFYVYATDAAGNSDDSAAFRQFAVDTTPPAVTINQASGQEDPTNDSPISFDVVFSEPVSDFTAADVTLSGTAGTGSPTVSGSGTTYVVSVPVTSEGTLIAAIPAGGAHDAAGNASTEATSNDRTVTYDITPPTVTINQASGQEDPTNDLPIRFDVVFSEPVSDFTAGDVTLGGSAAGASASVSGGGTTYVVSVSGLTSDGTVIADVPAGAAHDAAGNASTAAMGTDQTVTYDTTPPDTIIDTGPADGSSSPNTTATFAFHATEEGSTLRCRLDQGDLVACNEGTVTYTDLARGSHTFTVVATDRAGNEDPTPATRTFRVNTPPVANPDAYSMIGGAPLSVPAAQGVLANDTDADGDTLTAVVDTQPTRGTLTLDEDGSFAYIPGEDTVGEDTFTYHAFDGYDPSNIVTVTITVQAGCEGRAATQVGTAGRDTLGGTGGNDVILALGGNDVIDPGSGDDIVCGASGDDRILTGSGNDVARGGSGDDTLDAGSGDDVLHGDAGNDRLDAGGDRDRLFGDAGIDRLFGGGDDDTLDGGTDAPDLCDGEGGTDTATAACETTRNLP